jgi:hypothetical protein
MSGYYEEHPILVIRASDDVAETLAATLERRGLFVLGTPPPRLLGAQGILEDTLQLAQELSPFSVLDLADNLGISQQAANNRVKLLLNSGALVRRRVVPERGGKEFVYEVPKPQNRQSKSVSSKKRKPIRPRPRVGSSTA